jgi:hypothetical protein
MTRRSFNLLTRVLFDCGAKQALLRVAIHSLDWAHLRPTLALDVFQSVALHSNPSARQLFTISLSSSG